MSQALQILSDLFDIEPDYNFFDLYQPLSTFYKFTRYPLIDLYETKDEFQLIMDLPGVKKSEIKIESDSDSLEIHVGVESKTDKVKSYLRLKERSQDEIVRKVTFPAYIDPSKAKVILENGVLVITLPKAEQSKLTTLKIE